MLKVNGRITLLINSIITIKLHKAIGVPVGTRWANIGSGWIIHEYNICPNQIGRASFSVNTIYWVAAGMWGNSLIKLLKKINQNNPTMNQVEAGAENMPKIVLNSVFTKDEIFFKVI